MKETKVKIENGAVSNKPRKQNVANMKPINRAAKRAIAATKGKKNAINR